MDKTDIKIAAGRTFFERGESLYNRGHVISRVAMVTDEKTVARFMVAGDSGSQYYVKLILDKDGNIETYSCDCPAAASYPMMCKHAVAAALDYLDSEYAEKPEHRYVRKSDPIMQRVLHECSMEQKADSLQMDISGKVHLEPTLDCRYGQWNVEFKIGFSRMYILKNIYEFVDSIDKRAKVYYGKQLEFIHEESAFDAESRMIVEFLRGCIHRREDIFYQESRYSYYYPQDARILKLTEEETSSFFDIFENSFCNLNTGRSRTEKKLEIIKADPVLKTTLEVDEDNGFQLQLPQYQIVSGSRHMYLIKDNKAYQCSDGFRKAMETLCRRTAGTDKRSLYIAEEDMPVFCSSIYQSLDEFTRFSSSVDLSIYMPDSCTVSFWLDKSDGVVTCRVEGAYGENIINLLESLKTRDMYRDLQKEREAVGIARGYFPEEDVSAGLLCFMEDQDDLMYRLLTEGVEALYGVGEVYISDALKRVSITRVENAGVSVDISGGLLDIEIISDQLPYDELDEMLNSYRLRKKYHRLRNGDFLMLEDGVLEAVSELAEGLELDKDALKSGRISVPRYRSFYVDQVLKASGHVDVERSASYKELIRSIKSVEDSDFEVPPSLKGVLRGYQKDGYRWLMTMERLGFGGILADDMGLGKSLQMLTFLAENKGKGTSIIICPASLVYNWQDEIRKFVPYMDSRIVTGTAEQRHEIIQESMDADILITSYDLFRRDEEIYQGMAFYCEILDEAQHIKNHTTKAAKAVKKLDAQVRFALTGTPVENRLSELWSIFDFLMPGLLGSYKAFRNKYEMPVAVQHDDLAAARLQRMVSPFLLRRVKADVLKELPQKNENAVYVKLGEEQRKLYEANVRKLMDTIHSSDFSREKIKILAGITRLRQICCDPQLMYEDYDGEAAKLEMCMELLHNAVDGGHKVLLFSQFTSMLDILRSRIESEGISCHMLTGSTSKEKRAELVREFQHDDVPVFLISLKAGGTGLNLTAASIVIHFDPWWNVAVQNQATDRAHRIGQDKRVTVYKLIAGNTIEEKIEKLQQAKTELSDKIVSGEHNTLSALNQDELMELLK